MRQGGQREDRPLGRTGRTLSLENIQHKAGAWERGSRQGSRQVSELPSKGQASVSQTEEESKVMVLGACVDEPVMQAYVKSRVDENM